MSDDIRAGTNATLTVAEAAKADGGLILDAPGVDDDSTDERANRSLAAFAQEDDGNQQAGGERR